MKNKFCVKCGNPLEEGQKFCIACGTPVEEVVVPVVNEIPKQVAPKEQKNIVPIVIAAILGIVAVAIVGFLVFSMNHHSDNKVASAQSSSSKSSVASSSSSDSASKVSSSSSESSQESSNSSSSSSSSNANLISQLESGNYSALAGTWTSANGSESFDSNGNFTSVDGSKWTIDNVTTSDHGEIVIWFNLNPSYNGQRPGILLAPAGSDFSSFNLGGISDTSKTRFVGLTENNDGTSEHLNHDISQISGYVYEQGN